MPVTAGMLMAKRKRKSLYPGSSKKKQKTTYNSPAIRTPIGVSSRAGFGTRKVVNMIYCEKGINLTTPTVGGAGDYIFRINSIFDPNFTGGGHQPSLHDQMANIFERYTVYGCTYKVTFSNSSASNRQAVGVYVSDRSDTGADFTTLVEQGSVEWSTLPVATAGGSQRTFTGYVDLPKLMGMEKDQYIADANYCPEFGSDPNDPAFLHCIYADIAGGGTTVITLVIELVFNVLCLGTRLIPQS